MATKHLAKRNRMKKRTRADQKRLNVDRADQKRLYKKWAENFAEDSAENS